MAIYRRSHIQFAYFIFYSREKPFENIVIFSVDIAVIITFDQVSQVVKTKIKFDVKRLAKNVFIVYVDDATPVYNSQYGY